MASKKLILVFATIVFLSMRGAAHAQVVISEFVSDPETGKEWIEFRNDSSAEADLNGWSWTELAGPDSDTEHESSPRALDGALPPGGFFVLEISNLLNNAGDSIGLYHGTELSDRVTFGATAGYSEDLKPPAKGKSGARIGGGWRTSQSPTKGGANPTEASPEDSDDETRDDPDEKSPASSSGKPASSGAGVAPPVSAKIRTEISARPVGYVGIPFEFRGRVTQGGEQLYGGRYFWNFGDGDFREVKAVNTDTFTHTYYYPGEYTVIFEHYPNHFAETPDAAEEMLVRIITPQVSISRVGDERDFFVELSNNTDYDIDISGWMLAGYSKVFTVPKNTVLAADRKIIISGRTTGFSAEDRHNLRLLTSARDTAFEYSPVPVRTRPAQKVSALESPAAGTTVATDEEISAADFSASLAYAFEGEEASAGALVPFWWHILLFAFIGAAAFVVYRIRRKGFVSEPGSDFEIIDE